MVDIESARLVGRDDIVVMFKRVVDEERSIARGFAAVEDAIGGL
jgi:hypothetical protein